MKVKYRIKLRKARVEETSSSKRDRICRKILECGILGLIIFSPLPAASVYDWSILVIELTVLVMFASYVLMKRRPTHNELLSESLKWPKHLFTGFFIFLLIQIIPWTKFIVRALSPGAYSFRKMYAADFSRVKLLNFSLVPSQTFREGLELLTYFLLGFLIIKTVTHLDQIMRIFTVLFIMGVFEAFYGLFELYRKNPRILFYKKVYALDSVTGTFVNRNHFSGYMEMIIPLAIGLIIARTEIFSTAGLKWRERLLRLSEKGLSTNLILFAGVVIMSLAVVLSKSRSGVFLLILTFLLFFEFSALYFGRIRHQQRWVRNFIIVTFLVITFISLYVGVEATIGRFALDNLLKEGRPLYWRNITSIVSDFPLFGTGLGTFASIYPAYESYERITNPGRLTHAHNDYLEYLAELGVVGTGLLLGGILFMAFNAFMMWRLRRHPLVKGLTLGGIVAVIAMLVHSITDFNLHIPANMLLFTVVLSMIVVTAFYRRGEGNKHRSGVSGRK
ncbi:MAG: O-antigen ligase family protein [Candidatus Aminicenantales bacterium]